MLIGGFQNFDIENALKENSGEYFPLPFDRDENYTRQVFTNNGRTSTIYLFNNCFDFKEEDYILIPDYLCLSIITALEESKVPYKFYKIKKDLSIDKDSLKASITSHCKAIYLTHFFGTSYSTEDLDFFNKIRGQYSIPIIEDITQSLLTIPYDGFPGMGFGDYIVASTRKWFPNTDGGLFSARKGLDLPKAKLDPPYNEATYKQLLISFIRDFYDLKGMNLENFDYSSYVDWEKEANRVRYTDLVVREITPFSRNIMLNQDLSTISENRRFNYSHLYEQIVELSGIEILSDKLEDKPGLVPFGLVILVEDRDRVYSELARRGIIGEIQWILPTDYYTPGMDAIYLSDHNIMFQCDQRYDESHMDLIAGALKEIL